MVKAINLGVRAHDVGLEELPSYFSERAIETLADRVMSKGFGAVQFTMEDVFTEVKPFQLNQGMAWKLRKAFESRGIQIAILSCYKNLIHPDPEERKKELGCFRRYLEFCRELGCSYVATETGSKNINYSFHPDNHSPKAMEELLESLNQMLSWAKDLGVGIAIEGVSMFPARSPEVIKMILDCINSACLHIILDPVNLLEPAVCGAPEAVGEEIRQQYINIAGKSFNLFGDAIVAVHLKDVRINNGKWTNVPIGIGLAPFEFLIKLVMDRKPYLPLIMEEQNSLTMDDSINLIKGLVPGSDEQ